MSNNKQTSVDIIYQGMSDKIVMQDLNKALICIHISHDDFLKLHKQAKAMHKEEQIDSFIEGMYKGQEMYFSEHKIKLDNNSSVFCAAIAEHYYNETFNTHENNNRI